MITLLSVVHSLADLCASMRLRWRILAAVALVLACGITTAGVALADSPSVVGQAARGRVYAANCGTVGYLEYKPRMWGAGCTSGSPEVSPAKWTRWTTRKARAVGRSYVENCSPSCADPSKHAWYRSSVVLSHPKRCRHGARLRYFSVAVWRITYPRGNPFGEKPGTHRYVLRPLARSTHCVRK